jgi:hypothetical protein
VYLRDHLLIDTGCRCGIIKSFLPVNQTPQQALNPIVQQND